MAFKTPSTQQLRKFYKESGHKIVWSELKELTIGMRRKVLRPYKSNPPDFEQAPEWARRYVAEYLKSIRDDINKLIEDDNEDEWSKDDIFKHLY